MKHESHQSRLDVYWRRPWWHVRILSGVRVAPIRIWRRQYGAESVDLSKREYGVRFQCKVIDSFDFLWMQVLNNRDVCYQMKFGMVFHTIIFNTNLYSKKPWRRRGIPCLYKNRWTNISSLFLKIVRMWHCCFKLGVSVHWKCSATPSPILWAILNDPRLSC